MTRLVCFMASMAMIVATTTAQADLVPFVDNFDSGELGANLVVTGGPGSLTFSNGELLAGIDGSNDDGRIFVGTTETGFAGPNVTGFVAEITTTIIAGETNADTAFFGLGPGLPAGRFFEPTEGPVAVFGVRDDNAGGNANTTLLGDFAAGESGGAAGVAGEPGPGTHRLRLTYDGTTLQLSQQLNLTGAFVDTFSIDVSDNGFDETNSRIFFGGSNEAIFDDFAIVSVTTVAVPEPSSLAIMLGLGMTVLARRKRS